MQNNDAFVGALIVAVALAIYFAPWLLAKYRRHKNALAIFTTNLLLGWTLVGWIAALIWACTANTRSTEQK